ncbi:MAG: YggU family protein [Thermoplasmata archaeon]|nr:YggU family protein [Thermoplasmata archaeon]
MKEAVEETRDGCLIHIRVKIGNKSCFPAGYDAWRKRIEIEVSEKPERGKANQQIIKTIASFFSLPSSSLSIAYGETSREKGIFIRKEKNEILRMLENGSQSSAGGN